MLDAFCNTDCPCTEGASPSSSAPNTSCVQGRHSQVNTASLDSLSVLLLMCT